MCENNKSNKLSGRQGYIALISVIIISAVLVVTSVLLGTAGFFSRFNVADAEYKEQSRALAESCVNQALLHLAQGNTQTGNVSVGTDSCSIVAVNQSSPAAGQVTIQTQAVFNQAVTNFQVVVDAYTLSLISWQEVPSS